MPISISSGLELVESRTYSMKVVLGGLLSSRDASAASPPLAAAAVSSTSTLSTPSSPPISMSPAVSLRPVSPVEMWTSGSAMAGALRLQKHRCRGDVDLCAVRYLWARKSVCITELFKRTTSKTSKGSIDRTDRIDRKRQVRGWQRRAIMQTTRQTTCSHALPAFVYRTN